MKQWYHACLLTFLPFRPSSRGLSRQFFQEISAPNSSIILFFFTASIFIFKEWGYEYALMSPKLDLSFTYICILYIWFKAQKVNHVNWGEPCATGKDMGRSGWLSYITFLCFSLLDSISYFFLAFLKFYLSCTVHKLGGNMTGEKGSRCTLMLAKKMVWKCVQ